MEEPIDHLCTGIYAPLLTYISGFQTHQILGVIEHMDDADENLVLPRHKLLMRSFICYLNDNLERVVPRPDMAGAYRVYMSRNMNDLAAIEADTAVWLEFIDATDAASIKTLIEKSPKLQYIGFRHKVMYCSDFIKFISYLTNRHITVNLSDTKWMYDYGLDCFFVWPAEVFEYLVFMSKEQWNAYNSQTIYVWSLNLTKRDDYQTVKSIIEQTHRSYWDI